MTIMPYDKSSFLAGIAAGRNMKSVPFLEGHPGGVFSFTILISPSTTRNYKFSGYIDGAILWGDGTHETVTRVSGGHSHSYQADGIYTVVVSGTGYGFSFGSYSNYENNRCLLSINSPLLPPPDDVRPIYQNLGAFCQGCTNLRFLPDDLFKNHAVPRVYFNTFAESFAYCSHLENLPKRMFSGLHFGNSAGPLTHEKEMDSMFWYCISLKEIPGDLFSNTELSYFYSAQSIFQHCDALQVVREGAFDGLTGIGDISSAFYDCINLHRITDNLFSEMINLVDCRSIFYRCSSLEALPSGCFAGLSRVQMFGSLCYFCEGLQSIGSGCFDGCDSAQNFDNAFWGCKSISSEVPELWEDYPEASGIRCFRGCVNAQNYADIPAAWR